MAIIGLSRRKAKRQTNTLSLHWIYFDAYKHIIYYNIVFEKKTHTITSTYIGLNHLVNIYSHLYKMKTTTSCRLTVHVHGIRLKNIVRALPILRINTSA